MIERKIGERFPLNGRMIECVAEKPMKDCTTRDGDDCCFINGFCGRYLKEIGYCSHAKRSGKDSVCFIDVGPVPESMKIRYVENKDGLIMAKLETGLKKAGFNPLQSAAFKTLAVEQFLNEALKKFPEMEEQIKKLKETNAIQSVAVMVKIYSEGNQNG